MPPASAKYSPPESVVGMHINGMLGRDMLEGGLGAPRAYEARSVGVVMAFARHC